MKVLFLTHRAPFPPDRGDRIRAYRILQALARFAEVELISLSHDRGEADQLSGLGELVTRARAARVPGLLNKARACLALPGSQPLTHLLLASPEIDGLIAEAVENRPPDLVVAFCSSMAYWALRPPLDRFPFILDMVDVDSEKWRDLAARAALPMRWIYAREARLLSAFEARAADAARDSLVVTDRERASLLALAPKAAVTTMGNGVALDHFKNPGEPGEAGRLVFMGVMNYAPNEQGALWLMRAVWPRVLSRIPEARLTLLGSHPTRALKRQAALDPSVEVTGYVDDVRPHLWRSAVAAAPMAVARGIQNKVLESLAAGLPCVVTPAVAAGLPASLRAACPAAAEPEDFARELADLLAEDIDALRARAAAADLSALTWERQLAELRPICERALARGAAR